MNQLMLKKVEFNGDELIAVKEEDTGIIYVSISSVCKGIGLKESQKDRQIKNIKNDKVLKDDSKNFSVKYDGKIGNMTNMLYINIDSLPLWLAKISITPQMEKEIPDVVDKLITYQKKAKLVLANAFLRGGQSKMDSYMIEDPLARADAWKEEYKKRIQLEQTKLALEEKTETLQKEVTILSESHLSLNDRTIINKLIKRVGGRYNHRFDTAWDEFRNILYYHGININLRIVNYMKKHPEARSLPTTCDVIKEEEFPKVIQLAISYCETFSDIKIDDIINEIEYTYEFKGEEE